MERIATTATAGHGARIGGAAGIDGADSTKSSLEREGIWTTDASGLDLLGWRSLVEVESRADGAGTIEGDAFVVTDAFVGGCGFADACHTEGTRAAAGSSARSGSTAADIVADDVACADAVALDARAIDAGVAEPAAVLTADVLRLAAFGAFHAVFVIDDAHIAALAGAGTAEALVGAAADRIGLSAILERGGCGDRSADGGHIAAMAVVVLQAFVAGDTCVVGNAFAVAADFAGSAGLRRADAGSARAGSNLTEIVDLAFGAVFDGGTLAVVATVLAIAAGVWAIDGYAAGVEVGAAFISAVGLGEAAADAFGATTTARGGGLAGSAVVDSSTIVGEGAAAQAGGLAGGGCDTDADIAGAGQAGTTVAIRAALARGKAGAIADQLTGGTAQLFAVTGAVAAGVVAAGRASRTTVWAAGIRSTWTAAGAAVPGLGAGAGNRFGGGRWATGGIGRGGASQAGERGDRGGATL